MHRFKVRVALLVALATIGTFGFSTAPSGADPASPYDSIIGLRDLVAHWGDWRPESGTPGRVHAEACVGEQVFLQVWPQVGHDHGDERHLTPDVDIEVTITWGAGFVPTHHLQRSVAKNYPKIYTAPGEYLWSVFVRRTETDTRERYGGITVRDCKLEKALQGAGFRARKVTDENTGEGTKAVIAVDVPRNAIGSPRPVKVAWGDGTFSEGIVYYAPLALTGTITFDHTYPIWGQLEGLFIPGGVTYVQQLYKVLVTVREPSDVAQTLDLYHTC